MADDGASSMDDPVVRDLLQSRIPARLAYNWTDGTPRVVPIWFHWTGDELVFASFAHSPKAKALRNGAPVAVTIDSDTFPHRVVMVRGSAEIRRVDGIVDEYAAAARRYLGPAGGDAFLADLPEGAPMIRIALRPEQVRILDFETRFPSALSG